MHQKCCHFQKKNAVKQYGVLGVDLTANLDKFTISNMFGTIENQEIIKMNYLGTLLTQVFLATIENMLVAFLHFQHL